MNEWFEVDKIIELSQHYRALGPLIGILLPFIESFLPFLPLFVFVFANASAFGLGYGILIIMGRHDSWFICGIFIDSKIW